MGGIEIVAADNPKLLNEFVELPFRRPAFRERVRRCFKGDLKPPFNCEARAAAGFPADYYEPLAARPAQNEE